MNHEFTGRHLTPEEKLAYKMGVSDRKKEERAKKSRKMASRHYRRSQVGRTALIRSVQARVEADPESLPRALAKVEVEEWAHLPDTTRNLLMLAALEGTNKGIAARLGVAERTVYDMFARIPNGGQLYMEARRFRMRIVRELAELTMVKGIVHYHDMIDKDDAGKPSMVVQRAIHDLAEMTGAIQRHPTVAVGVRQTVVINTPWKDGPPVVEVTAQEMADGNAGAESPVSAP